MTAYWLITERLENWTADERGGFRRFGLPERRRKTAEEIKCGDIFIVYVSSGVSAFAGTRRVDSDRLCRLGIDSDYDTSYTISVGTTPLLTLPRERWVKIHDLVDHLSLTRGKKDWRNYVRPAIQRLNEQDVRVLLAAIDEAATKEAVWYDREKLYEQVWSEPVSHVASSYEVSGVYLARVCRALRVPVPQRGYWSRLRSGQAMRRRPLPPLKQT